MKTSLLTFIVVISVWASSAFAINRFSVPIASSMWDEALPEGEHPSFASDLGNLQEGRISAGFVPSGLGDLSLSLPGFQVISANAPWSKQGDSMSYRFEPSQQYLFDSSGVPLSRIRGYFLVGGGVSMSSLFTAPRDWDVGVGVSLENEQVFDSSGDNRIWSKHNLGGALTLRYGTFSLAGSGSPDEIRVRLGRLVPADYQVGVVVFDNPNADQAIGFQVAGEKIFHESMKVKGGMMYEFAKIGTGDTAYTQNISQQLMMGLSLRLRPWRAGVDPDWLQMIVSPCGGVDSFSRFLYDWEVSATLLVDMKHSGSSGVFTLARWF